MREREQKIGRDLHRFIAFWTEERSLTVMLLLLVLDLFILTPARFLGQVLHVFSVLFFSFALLVGLLTLVKQKALRRIGIVVVVGAILCKSAAFVSKPFWLSVSGTLLTFFSLLALVYVVFLQVNREGPVTGHRIRGAVALYLLIAMLFAFLYSLAEELAPGAFTMPEGWSRAASSGEAFYYFSIVTMTTVGFGDITAVNPFVRSLVGLEALIGQLYPAILIARLVTLEIETRRGRK